ncbi:hypothetical protein C8J56DRAFT_922584 [Mycena floridula]|nr:hypothetical protein C8J56DRAFT_922584 [Mycena floridula]
MARTLLSDSLAIFWTALFSSLATCSSILAAAFLVNVIFTRPIPYANFFKMTQIIATIALVCEVFVACSIFIFASCARVFRRWLPASFQQPRFAENLRLLRQKQRGWAVPNTWSTMAGAMVILVIMLVPGAVVNREPGSPLFFGQIITLVDDPDAIIMLLVLLVSSILVASIFFFASMTRIARGSPAPDEIWRVEVPIFLDLAVVIGRIVAVPERNGEADEPGSSKDSRDLEAERLVEI